MTIADSIKLLSNKKDNNYNVVCTVKSFDSTENTCYCLPINGDADIFGVRVISDNKKGFLLIPKVGSVVIVSFLDNALPFISMFSEVDKIEINGSNYEGIVKVNELVTKINSLENLINNILTTLKNTTIPLAPSGTYPFLPLYTAFSNIVPITNKNDLQNPKVLHGDGI